MVSHVAQLINLVAGNSNLDQDGRITPHPLPQNAGDLGYPFITVLKVIGRRWRITSLMDRFIGYSSPLCRSNLLG